MIGVDGLFSTCFIKALKPQQVGTVWRPKPPILPIDMQRQIELYWDALPKGSFFNGRLARLADWHLEKEALTLNLQPSDYRTLLFSNEHVERIERTWGYGCLSRALGISALLESGDRQLVFIKRSDSVGEFPGAHDLFGGHIDVPSDSSPDVFAAMAQELEQEAGLTRDRFELTLIGMIESTPNRKPELIFSAKTQMPLAEIKERVRRARDRSEFSEIFTVPNEIEPLRDLLKNDQDQWSPSAYGGVSLYLDALSRNIKERLNES